MKYSKKNLVVGQPVVLKWDGNKARGGNGYTEGVIEKLGSKYITVKGIQFNYDGIQKTDYSADFIFFGSMEEYLDNEEYHKKYSEIGRKFEFWASKDLTLDQIRRIHDIINE